MSIVISGGDNAGRMNLLLMSEGYLATDRPLFDQHVEQLAAQIRREFWYRQGLLNVHAEWVPSDERAPTAPTGKPNKTYFQSYYGGDRAAHVISGDDEAVTRLSAAWGDLGWKRHAIVLVNSTLYGGRGGGQGGGMCWSYTDSRRSSSWTACALHELGHSLFGLADEYGGPGRSPRTREPKEPNITIDPRGAKWRHLVNGAVEGADKYDLGIYRPTRYCRMRDFMTPFCAVCADAARRTLEGYLSEPLEEPPAVKLFSVVHQGETKQFSDDVSGIIASSAWLFGRKFGSTKSN